jgi:uncharacterized protein (DUF58 family)
MATASIANHAIESGYRVGLYVNQKKMQPDEFIRIPPSQHSEQWRCILEALAQIHPSEAMPIARFVTNEGHNLPWGSTMMVITAIPTDDLLSTLIGLKRAGRQVVLVVVGGTEPATGTDGLRVYHISDEVAWRELESLSVEEQ